MALDGAIILNLLVAGVLTLISGTVALLLLQRAMVRNMMATAGRPPPADEAGPQRRPASRPLAIVFDDTAQPGRDPSRAILFRACAAHVLAGLAFAVSAAVLLLLLSGMELLPLRTAVVVLAFAWPVVLVLNFLTGPDRWRQAAIIGAYFGLLLVLCGLAAARGTESLELGGITIPGFGQPLLFWAIYAAPSVFLLLFLNRTIRAIGPTVIVFVIVLLFGSQIALLIVRTQPLLDMAVHFAVATGLGGNGLFWGTVVLGLLAAIWPAWRCATFLSDRYAAKRTSDVLVTAGAIWILQALMLSFNFGREHGAVGVLAAIVPLLAWRLTLAAGLRPLVREAENRPEFRLLLLRVFGFGRRSRRLLDLLGARWRLIGSIDLIAAPDLASRTIEPATFMGFVRGRLSAFFIQDVAQLQTRFATLDHRPDPDARYRMNPLFCGNDMWKDAVIRLMRDASLVVMDLRGFSPERRGCIYELQTLLDVVSLDRLVFLVDVTTHVDALAGILMERWQELRADSPNIDLGNPRIRLINQAEGDAKAVLHLMATAGLDRGKA